MTTDQDHGLDPIRLLRELIAAFNRYDLDTAMSFFVEDCIYRTPRGRRPWGRNVTGSADVRAAFERQFGRFQDARFIDDSHWVSGDRGVSGWARGGRIAPREGEEGRRRLADRGALGLGSSHDPGAARDEESADGVVP